MTSSFKFISCEISEKNAWNNALSGIDVSVYFTWEYLSILQLNYSSRIYLLKIYNDQGGLITFFTKRTKDQKSFDIYSPYAMDGVHIWGTSDKVIAEFINYLAKDNIATYYLANHPGYKFIQNDNFTSYRSLYTLNLTLDSLLLWNNLDPNHRYEINKFSKQQHQIVTDKLLIKEPFLNLYHETFERVKANNSYNFSNEFLSELIDSDITYACGAFINGNIECVIILLIKNNWAEYYINASSLAGRNATRALIWNAILHLKENGIRLLNLGGGIIENDSLDQFKKKFGGEKKKMNLFRGIASPDGFNRLCKEYNVSVESTNYFPPYWANNSK
jgi:hypothetical protein